MSSDLTGYTSDSVDRIHGKLQKAKDEQKEAKTTVNKALQKAKEKIESAKHQVEESQRDLKQIIGKDPAAPTIAGYTIGDLLRAPVKAPEPHVGDSTIDPDTKHQLEQEFKETKQRVDKIDKRIHRADA